MIETDAPAVIGPPQGEWNYDAWEALPDDGNRYEVIDGSLYTTTAPSNFHQWIIRRLDRHIGIPAEDQGLAYIFTAPVGLLMPGCDPVQPDFVVITQANAAIIHDRRIRGVPDLIVEVLSPGNAAYDERVKLLAYALAGVPEYVIVDPATRRLSHYRLLPTRQRYATPTVLGTNETVAFDCLPALSFSVGALFAGAPDTTL